MKAVTPIVLIVGALLCSEVSASIDIVIDWTVGSQPTDFGYSINHGSVDTGAGPWSSSGGSPRLHEQNNLVNSLDDAATTPFVPGYADIQHISFDSQHQSVFLNGFRKDRDILFDLTAVENVYRIAHGDFSNTADIAVVNNDGQQHRYGWELDRAASIVKIFFDGAQVGAPGGYSVSTAVTDTEHWFGDRQGSADNSEVWSSFVIQSGQIPEPSTAMLIIAGGLGLLASAFRKHARQ